jgi:hypothetical protein
MKTNVFKYWREFLIGVGIFFAFSYFYNPKTEFLEIPVKLEVPVPVIEKEFDTVYKPYPVYLKGEVVKEIDSLYYKKYQQLLDQESKDSLFKEAIKIKSYKEVVEDDTVAITLNMKVRGDLLNYQLGYKTKPYTIPLDTTLRVEIPATNKFFYGLSTGIPIEDDYITPILKLDLHWKTKSNNLINLSLDSNRNVWIGYAWEF